MLLIMNTKQDILVYKLKNKYEVKGNAGLWYFTEQNYQADFKIFFVEQEYQSDLKVFL